MKRAARLAMQIGWPSFLTACVLEMLVFSMVDPSQLHWMGGAPVALGPTAVYSLAFFAFWVVGALGAGVALLLAEPAAEINSRSFSR